jgi:hypothetical protein
MFYRLCTNGYTVCVSVPFNSPEDLALQAYQDGRHVWLV